MVHIECFNPLSHYVTANLLTVEQVKVILKLFVVMGVTWLSDLCYFIVGWAVGREVVWKYFAINDFINFSQGNLRGSTFYLRRSR